MAESIQSEKNCDIHLQRICQMFCLDCRISVCLSCIGGEHRGHCFTELIPEQTSLNTEDQTSVRNKDKTSSETMEQNYFDIKEYIAELMKNDVSKIQNKLKQIKQIISQNNERTIACTAEIKKQGLNMKQEIDKITHGLVDKCKKGKKLKEQKLKEKETILDTKLEELQELIQQTKEKPRGGHQQIRQNIQVIIQDINVLCEDGSDLDDNKVSSVFSPGECNVTTLTQMFGKITQKETEHDKSSDVEPIIEVKVISTFLASEKINNLAVVDSEKAWITNKNCARLLRSDGTEVRSVKLDFNIYSIALTSNGEILLASQMNIKKLLPNGHMKSFIDSTPYSNNGMYVTSDGDILVCLYDWFKQDGKVARFSFAGQKKQTVQYIKHVQENIPIFTKPQCVTEAVNGDICVTNIDSKDSGSVIVTNKDGILRFSYNGMNMKKPFCPQGLVSDKHGHLLILDKNNDVIHMLDLNGEFLNFLFTKDHGLSQPRIISGNRDGTVWISCDSNNKIIVAKYFS